MANYADLPNLADMYAAEYAQPPAQVSQLPAADKALHLTPQERALYERHIANLWGSGGVDNPDGSRSSLFQMGADIDGRTFNLPTVYEGRILPPDAAVERAVQAGLDNFPSYPTPEAAEARYGAMHDFMDRDTAAYLDVRRRAPMVPATVADMFR